jgi:hypothetical protein
VDRKAHIAAWQKGLEEAFSTDEIVGGKYLAEVQAEEDECGACIVFKYRGHRVVHDSFFEFFGATLTLAFQHVRQFGWPPNSPQYLIGFLHFLTLFRVARAADKLAIAGYPLDGYAVLRSLKEQAFALAGVVLGYSSFGRLVPDHKTIADFRKDNGAAIRKVCARFVTLCREFGLLTNASVAIDGSKFKAVNTRDKNFTRAKMERRLAQIEESVARYLVGLGGQ